MAANKTTSPPAKIPLGVQMLTGGLAGSIAEIATIPLDTAKVRLQIQGSQLKPGEAAKYRGLIHCVIKIAQEEGPSYLYKGLVAGLQRQMVFASLRIGLYDSVRDFYCGKDAKGDPPLIKKILAGLTTGAFGITIANPTDVVKVRLQAEGRLPPDVPRKYKNVTDAYRKIVQQEGVGGLWRGWAPNVLRNSVINAVELASYDEIKYQIISSGLLKDGAPCHLVSSALAGLLAVVFGSPFDVVKTRMMNSQKGVGESYKNPLDCVVKTLSKEGPLAFYGGFIANCARLVSWNVVMFMSLQQLRQMYSNAYLKH